MYILSINGWFITLVRQFFLLIDQIVYNFIGTVYNLLILIARTSILSQSDIVNMTERVYMLLTVFMVFKVTFSLIMYVVNPDDFSDKNKGVSKLGLNIVISLAMLVLVPYVFNYAYKLQTIILEDNSLATLIFGEGNTKNDFMNSAGENMAYITLQPFFTVNTSIEGLEVCTNPSTQTCYEAITRIQEFRTQASTNYIAGVTRKKLGLILRDDIVVSKNDDGEFLIDYKFVFSTVVGIVIIALLISYCMDIALRSIKLAFLQLVAPIPIISYVDPKSGKDGLFKKWYTMCFKTYLSLFIRLIALYFAVYIIAAVSDMQLTDLVDGSVQSNGWVQIFIIIGALMFAKQLPKILEGLGIKLDGDGKFFLNPIKKFSEQALGGKKIIGLGAAGAAAGLAGATNFASRTLHPNSWRGADGKFSFKNGMKNLAKAPGSAVAGAASAMKRGTVKAMKGESAGKIFTNSYGEAMFAKIQREDLNRKGSTIVGRAIADLNRYTGNLNAAQRQELELSTLDGEKNSRITDIKKKREAMELGRQEMLEEKRTVQKTHTDNHKNLSLIVDRINNLKGVSYGGKKINVKDRDEKVNNLKANDKYYAKVGDYIWDEERKVVRRAKQKDIDELKLTIDAYNADKALSEEKDRALKYLLNEDDEVKERATILSANGINISDMTASNLKTEMVNEKNAVAAIDAKYYTREEEYKKQEEQFKLEEKYIDDWYKNEIKNRHLDKSSAEWIANEADNASRAVKNPQPEGFMPKAEVDEKSYTPFTTGLMMGNGPSEGGQNPPSGGRPKP